MDRLRIGFIGCGRHATKALYPSLRYAPIDLVAVCDADGERARRNADWFGAEHVFTNHQAMLDAGGLDAVAVVTGPGSHARLATAVMEAGLPVFIEKPPALRLADSEALAETSRRLGRPVTVGMMKRHAPAYGRLRELIAAEGFGAVSYVSSTFRVGAKRSSGYAFLLDAGIHHLDLLRHLAGDYEIVASQRHDGTEGITYALLLSFASGALGSVHLSDQGSWLGKTESVEMTGVGNIATAENLVRVQHVGSDGVTTAWEPGFSIPQNANNSFFIQGYAPQFQAWAQALLEGRPPPALIADVCETLRLIKHLEPDEDYAKEPMRFPHWEVDDEWLD